MADELTAEEEATLRGDVVLTVWLADSCRPWAAWTHTTLARLFATLDVDRARIAALEVERDEHALRREETVAMATQLQTERDAVAAKFSKELTETLLAYDAKWQPVVDALAAEVAGLRQLAWDGWEQAVLWEQTEHACDTQYDRLAERVARLVAAVTQHVCYKCHDAVGLRGMHADRPVGCRFCNPLRAAHAEWST